MTYPRKLEREPQVGDLYVFVKHLRNPVGRFGMKPLFWRYRVNRLLVQSAYQQAGCVSLADIKTAALVVGVGADDVINMLIGHQKWDARFELAGSGFLFEGNPFRDTAVTHMEKTLMFGYNSAVHGNLLVHYRYNPYFGNKIERIFPKV